MAQMTGFSEEGFVERDSIISHPPLWELQC